SGLGAAPPGKDTRYRFHQPEASEIAYRLSSSRQSGASTDSAGPPITSAAAATVTPVTGPTRRSGPPQGIRRWAQWIPASFVPSGEETGNAKKSAPVTRTRTPSGHEAAEPSNGTATIARATRPSAETVSRTHQTSRPSGESTRSANRKPPSADVSGRGSPGRAPALLTTYRRWSAKLAKTRSDPSPEG